MWDRPWTRCSHRMPRVGDDQEGRRRHQRAPVDLQVSLKFPSVQQFLSAYAGDVSESGMFIRTEGPAHQPGELVTLRFEAGEERIVQGKARVVRVEAGGIGVEFEEVDETSRRLIEVRGCERSADASHVWLFVEGGRARRCAGPAATRSEHIRQSRGWLYGRDRSDAGACGVASLPGQHRAARGA